jgi:signal transduction histidine kinase
MAGEDRGEKSSAVAPPAGGSAAYFEILALVARSLLDEDLNLDERLRLTLRLATEALGADRGSVMIADETSKELRMRASMGLPRQARNFPIRFGEGITGWVAANNQPLVLHGDVEDSRFKGKDPSIDSSLSLPLSVEERVLGVLNIVRQSGGRFTEDDLRLASSLADLAALAIEKAKLYLALREREKRVTSLLAAAINAQEQERRRIAADIHDGFLQNLSALFLKAEKAKVQLDQANLDEASSAIKEIQDVVVSEMTAMRDYIFEIRPPSLDEIGLEPTLQAMVDRVASEHLLVGRFRQTGTDERLPEPVEAIFYRTAQEALRNIVKHSGAKTFIVSLEKIDREARLRIRDDGRGLEKNTDQVPRRGHYGIDTMRERVELAGGRFQIGRRRGGGTEVKVVIPLG